MATATEAQQRAALKLKSLELMVNDLAEVAAEWGELEWGDSATNEQLAWSLDWDNEMAGLKSLARYAADGILSVDQQGRYERVIQKLKDALPLIDRLNLQHPPVPLEP